MSFDSYNALLFLMWLALPLTARKYWEAWDSLPDRIAVHFDVAFKPNGYTSKRAAVIFALGIMAFMLATLTFTAAIVRAARPDAAWVVLLVSYAVLGVLWFVNSFIIKFNLQSDRPSL